jgi:hypothetical protein
VTRLRSVWESDTLRKILLAVLVVYIVVASSVIIFQQYQQYHFTQVAHSNTVSLLNEHTQTLKVISQLQNEVANGYIKGVPEITTGQQALLNKLSWIECEVASAKDQCGPMP